MAALSFDMNKCRVNLFLEQMTGQGAWAVDEVLECIFALHFMVMELRSIGDTPQKSPREPLSQMRLLFVDLEHSTVCNAFHWLGK